MNTLLLHFVVYANLGFLIEAYFTSLTNDGEAKVHIINALVWSVGGMLLDLAYFIDGGGFSYVPLHAGIIMAYEYGAGYLLRAARLPVWKYEKGWHIDGLVRLDYAPFWFCAAVGFELLQRAI